MYLPGKFAVTDERKIHGLMEENPFATLLSFPGGTPPVFVNHLPLVFSDSTGERKVIYGHMSRQNPQWRHFRENPSCLAVFHGPHAYISPLWYRSGRDVPTWNYAVVHVQGKIELVEEGERQMEILRLLTLKFEGERPGSWRFTLPDDLKDPALLESAIISFRLKVEGIEAKFKLSQNRSSADREGVIDGLGGRTDDASAGVRKLMEISGE